MTVPVDRLELELVYLAWPRATPSAMGYTTWNKLRGELRGYECSVDGAHYVLRKGGHEIRIPAAVCLAEYSDTPPPKTRRPTMADAIAEKEAREAAEAAAKARSDAETEKTEPDDEPPPKRGPGRPRKSEARP